ncbi:MAG TPA: serine/threonine-protein kinase [Nocardioides sp.]|uniref:serine/threonine-protein kinase n=1 Tax=Nocardioides sp. TaxID=35761 RepID=UPI002F405E01
MIEERRVVAGRYDLEREVGRGGMGSVWLARDTVLGREVALKRVGLMPGAQLPDLQRAEREARLAARLNHPHVVAVFDLVEDDDETWLVMEYVEGITLAAFVKRDGALIPDEAAPLVRQAADALAAAHEAGIVHRDVKPSNMLVTPAGEVKLTDFGIARAEADASLTRTGLVTGSPAYLAPEVASGSSATEASDVWSLGATLFHLLAGHPPYDVNENLMGALYRIVHEDPPRLTNAGWLAPALEHAMTPKPEDRWSMAQVRDFLVHGDQITIHPVPFGALDEDGTRVLHPTPSAPVAVPPVPLDPPASEPAATARRTRRSPWPWAVAVAAIIAAAVIAAAALSGSRDGSSPSASPPSHPAARTTSSSPEATHPATAMRSFITTYLSTVTSDQHASWAMLTPAFQQASGGFGRYQGFWRMYRSATPRDITPDPEGMTVSYGVDYVKTDGETSSDEVTLRLVKDGSSYLIDGES